mgnify:CR=1 FL=1|jgi:hypothetical protein
MTELKSYLVTKLLIPLLDDNITKEDVSPNSGFVAAYTEDINRPYLDNHIFLLYDTEVNTIEAMNRYKKFRCLDTLYNYRYVIVNRKHYMIYTFTRVNNKEITNIINTGLVSKHKDALNIYNFWKDLDEDTTRRIFKLKYSNSIELIHSVPEEDYYPYEDKLP